MFILALVAALIMATGVPILQFLGLAMLILLAAYDQNLPHRK
jgi:uncharacterized membrane protein